MHSLLRPSDLEMSSTCSIHICGTRLSKDILYAQYMQYAGQLTQLQMYHDYGSLLKLTYQVYVAEFGQMDIMEDQLLHSMFYLIV